MAGSLLDAPREGNIDRLLHGRRPAMKGVFGLGLKESLRTIFKSIDLDLDYTADLTGIGDRSVHVTKDVSFRM